MRDIVTSAAEVVGVSLIVVGLAVWLGTAAGCIAAGSALLAGSWLYTRSSR